MLCRALYSAMIASYSTTIPVHVQDAFDWGSLPTGLLFFGLQGPIIILSPLFGWLRDKVGTRLPASLGFLLLAPLIWLPGAADRRRFPWAASLDAAKHTYIAAVIGIGCVTNLMSSVGTMEITSELSVFSLGFFLLFTISPPPVYQKHAQKGSPTSRSCLFNSFASLLGAVDYFESKQPGIFGSKGGYSRCFSFNNVSFSSGLVIGPLLSGVLADSVGYHYMNCCVGEFLVISLCVGLHRLLTGIV